MLFGLLATVMFLLQSDWPPSRLVQDTGVAIFDSANGNWPHLQRYLLLMGLTIGMWFAAFRAKTFRLKGITFKKMLR